MAVQAYRPKGGRHAFPTVAALRWSASFARDPVRLPSGAPPRNKSAKAVALTDSPDDWISI